MPDYAGVTTAQRWTNLHTPFRSNNAIWRHRAGITIQADFIFSCCRSECILIIPYGICICHIHVDSMLLLSRLPQPECRRRAAGNGVLMVS
jgi:hypothetical protein